MTYCPNCGTKKASVKKAADMPKALTIMISMENDSFAEEPMGELAKLLRLLAKKCETQGIDNGDKIKDSNGNSVGTIKLK